MTNEHTRLTTESHKILEINNGNKLNGDKVNTLQFLVKNLRRINNTLYISKFFTDNKYKVA